MSLLELKDIHVGFRQDGKTVEAVRGVSFHLDQGETLAVVGESGSGKSVSALSTLGLLGSAAQVSGSAKFDGQELIGASERTLRGIRGNDISFIFQEPMTSLNPLHRLERQIGESLALHQGLRGEKARARSLELLNRVGIPRAQERLTAFPHELSGGQRQRVMIAMALANRPKLLIADEPTTALDVTIEAQILELLMELKRDEGLSMLFITHDLGLVRQFADRVVVMKQGEVVETAPTAQLFDAPQHEYTQTLLAAAQSGQPKAPPVDAKPMLKTDTLAVRFPIQKGFFKRTVGYVEAVRGAELELVEGETLGLVGESGSGKTTLALAVMRLIESQGGLWFNDRDITELPTRQLRNLRRDMQIVFQDPYGALSPRMTAEQVIAEGLGVHGLNKGQDQRAMVAEIMEEIGLDPAWMDRYPHEFSGGQRQRIAIARAMILRPRLIVLDEPTSALDMTVQVSIVELLRNLQERHRLTYLFISHDLRVVRAMSHRVAVMKDGDIVEQGPVNEVFDNPQSAYTQTLMQAAFRKSA